MASKQNGTEIGELIDTLIEQERAKTNQKLTAYLEEIVSPDAELSPRQIGRIRTISSDFPEGEAIQKLAKAIPQVSILDPSDIVNRLLWSWPNIQYDQEENLKAELIEGKQVGHSITIFSGWQQPIGLEREDVVKSIAKNIRQGFTYTFVYPDSNTYPQNSNNVLENINVDPVKSIISSWIEELKNNVSLAWLHEKRSSIDRTQLSNKLNEFLVELDSKIKFSQTIANTDIWLNLPSNYCVFYNLGSTRERKFKYGSFKVEGQLINSSVQIDEIFSSGWLHTTREQYRLIEDSYENAIQKNAAQPNNKLSELET
jgi:hypothetical protein